jgi:lysophospholipase L1-like esterase
VSAGGRVRSTLASGLSGLTITVATLVLLAALAEGGTRLYYYYESRRFIHPYLGETHKPHHHVTGRTPEGEPYAYRLNNYGFRGDDIPEQKPPGALYVFTIGGSTTACNEYPGDKTWPGVLEQSLRTALGNTDVRVFNAGMAGATSYRSLLVFLNQLTRLSPDLVIVYEAVNDMGPSRPSRARYFRDIGNREHFMQRRSYFMIEVARRTQHPLIMRLGGLLPDSRLVTNDFGYHEKNYRDIAHLARGYGIPLLFMTQPVMPDLADTRGMNASTRALGRDLGVPVFDLAGALPLDFEHFLPDRVHYTAQGNRRIGTRLGEWIAEQRLLGSPTSRPRAVPRQLTDRR